jgi:SAM-dependent methyltransferase
MVLQIKGYVTDVPYVRAFVHQCAPAWLDHVAVVSGVVPPAREDGFAWCDLGCGQGVTAAMLAAMHPAGHFHGIDAMPEHIDHGRRFAAEAGVTNANFYAVDFAAATDLALPKFDYVVAHGVYSWVGPQVRADMRTFLDRHLKRSGLVYLSYNAMPGRAADLPFQRLGAVDPKTTRCLTPPRPVISCKSSDGTVKNQTCSDEGPLTLERSKTVDEKISAKVIDFLDRNDPRRTNKPLGLGGKKVHAL